MQGAQGELLRHSLRLLSRSILHLPGLPVPHPGLDEDVVGCSLSSPILRGSLALWYGRAAGPLVPAPQDPPLKVLLYGNCTGVAYCRLMAYLLPEDIAFRVLAADNKLDCRSLSNFSKDHLEALSRRCHPGR